MPDEAEVLQRAKELFWEDSEGWTGNRWDWDKAGAEVQQRFIQHARNGTRPWSRQDSDAGIQPG